MYRRGFGGGGGVCALTDGYVYHSCRELPRLRSADLVALRVRRVARLQPHLCLIEGGLAASVRVGSQVAALEQRHNPV